MNAEQFCAEYGHECRNGRISFTKRVVDRFIRIYTTHSPAEFTDKMRERLKVMVMIDLHTNGYSKYGNRTDLPAEQIELPQEIFL